MTSVDVVRSENRRTVCMHSGKWFLPLAMLTANAEAESNCSSSCRTKLLCKLWCKRLEFFVDALIPPPLLTAALPLTKPLAGTTIDDDPDPVEVVSEMEEPEEKGGSERSDGDGDEGAPPLRLASSLEFWGWWCKLGGWRRGEEKVVVVTLDVRRRGLNLGASLNDTEMRKNNF